MNSIASYILSIFLSVYAFQLVPFSDLEEAFRNADASYIMNNVGDKVLIKVLDKEAVYSPSQGEQVLKRFFESVPSDEFEFIHKGKEKGANSFALGSYMNGSEEYRISLKFKLYRESYKIEVITIEKP